MVQRMVTCLVTMVALGGGLPIAAQSDTSDGARRERELVLEREQEAREQQAREREQEREQQIREREQQALERAERAQLAVDSAEMRRELAKAREQLAASAGEIARLSAQMTAPVLRTAPNIVQLAVGGQPALGLNVQDSDLGVLVSGVTPNGPAADAGVRVGDTIVAIDGVDVMRAAADGRRSPSAVLLAQVNDVEAGGDVDLRILRDGDYRDIVVEAADKRSPFVSIVNDGYSHIVQPGTWVGSFGRFGGPWSDVELVALTAALGEYFGVEEGLLVVRAGRAAELGLRDGDVILEIGGRQPQSPEHAMRILGSFEPGESLQASIMRQRRRETLTIPVPEGTGDGWIRLIR